MKSPRVRSSVFVLIFGFAVASYLQRQGIGIAAGRMMPELGLSQQQIGWIMNAFLIVYAACQVPGALFGQRFGARLTLTLIGIVAVLASVLTAAAPLIASAGLLFATLLLARALLGIAHGGLYPVEAGTVRHWYPVARWSSMLGLIVTGLWTGAAIASPLVATLMQAYGWQAALILTSVPSLLLVMLWWFVARDVPEQHPRVTPAELAELAGNPPYDAAAPLTARRVLRVLGDPQVLLLTLSYLVMNLRLLSRDVLELPVPGAGPEALRARKRLARRAALRGRGHRLGHRRARCGPVAPALRPPRGRPHRAASRAAARGRLPLPDRGGRESLLGHCRSLPRFRLRRIQ